MKKSLVLCLVLCLMLLSSALAEGAIVAPANPAGMPVSAPSEPQEASELSLIETIAERHALIHALRIEAAQRLVAPKQPEALPLSGVIIGIDPGHQLHGSSIQEPIAPGSKTTKNRVTGGTTGVSTGIPEYITNLEIGLQLRDALEALGATVVMTREVHEVDISNIERAQMMNEAGVALCLRLHCDGSTNNETHGITTYCKATGEGASESYTAAQDVLAAMGEVTGTRTRGVIVNDNYTGQNWSTVPCIMVEMGFLSNPQEDVLLNSADYQQLLVEGMVQGIMRFVGVCE